jgi:BirA family biotin operon repressor/biotin-[acetyl-CoA-carboxylase] ligase
MTDSSHEFDGALICCQTAVRRVEVRDELPSTNDLALELAVAAPAAELPLLVVAGRQTSGRGRGDHRWWSTDGALTFSLVLDTEALQLQPRRWPRISLATGIAVANTVRSQLPLESKSNQKMPGSEVRVKWPNDVFVNGRKICGILTENVSQLPHRLVIGIGLNVNNSWHDAPDELQKIGISLVDLSDRQFSRQVILVELLQRLYQALTDLALDVFPLTEAWRALCLLEGHTVTVEVGGKRTTGVCHGIDDDGALLLQNESGIERCVAGTVAKIH